MSMIKNEPDWSYTVWPGMIAISLAGFSVAEYAAYRADLTAHPCRKTLSRSLQRWLGVSPRKKHCRYIEAGLMFSVLALLVHVERMPPLVLPVSSLER